MERKKKDGRYINYYIEREICEQLEECCNEVGETKRMAIGRILKQYLDKYLMKKKLNKIVELGIDSNLIINLKRI